MPVENNPLRTTEYRFTGVLTPPGRDHLLADRRGHACAVVGYDLDLDRDAPLTFLVRFADGFETHVLPEEVDDHAPYRNHDPTVPPAPEHDDVPGAERYRQARKLREGIFHASFAWHEATLFDGTPNPEYHAGAEDALRAYAEVFGLEVPGEDETEEQVLQRIESAYPENSDVAAYIAAARRRRSVGPGMSRTKTLGVLVERVPGDPPTFSAGVVWGAAPFLSGVEQGATPEAAVAALKGSLRRLYHEPAVVVFDTMEAAQAEGRRRLAAEDLLQHLDLAAARLPGLLAGGGGDADERDRGALDGLDRAVRAVRAVADGAYDDGEKLEARPPIKDGRIVCPRCGPDYPDAYFTATADALTTAYLSPTGGLTAWKDVYVSEETYRELQCGSCGASLGDLIPEDIRILHRHLEEDAAP